MLPVSRIALIAARLAAPAVALAAAPATAPAPTTDQSLGGPVVPGVCVLSREAVFATAKVGQAASARLKTLTDQAQAEVNSDRATTVMRLPPFPPPNGSTLSRERR